MDKLNIISQIKNRQQEKKDNLQSSDGFKTRILAEKSKILLPIKELLQQLSDHKILMHHNHYYELNNPYVPKVQFTFYEAASCPTCSPGMSLNFDHPALVEIAVPNNINRNGNGMVHIYVGSPHPDGWMLAQKFKTVELAISALTKFFTENALD